ncbi:MAG: hypothetical protein WCO30_02230, partial [bacterium]
LLDNQLTKIYFIVISYPEPNPGQTKLEINMSEGKHVPTDAPFTLVLIPGGKKGETRIVLLEKLEPIEELVVYSENPQALANLFAKMKGLTIAKTENIEGKVMVYLIHM